ncbi:MULTISPECIES: hypothetical protein [Sinorhizobium]|uniref:hypothetical protein n=1 Tax=Sinorhizobium sp. NG07B TaxID=1538174 RepID=UPI001F3A8F1B|nr:MULTISPECIES: hypothetical protein [Sinorhizobium]
MEHERKSWFVPGTTAAGRIERWLAREAERADIHGDAKGRDAYDFEPIVSPYLEVRDDLRIRTPYSRSVIELLRGIPWAHWDEDGRVWRVPFRSYEELQRHWPRIEEAARRSEPGKKAPPRCGKRFRGRESGESAGRGKASPPLSPPR